MAGARPRAAHPGISEPRLRVDATGASRAGDGWEVRWRVVNTGERPVRLLAAVLPHAGFRAEERPLDLAVDANRLHFFDPETGDAIYSA